MRKKNEDIIITTTDLEGLRPLLDLHDSPAAEALDAEIHRARIVEPEKAPADVVTMNSEVVYEDCETSAKRTVRVVYPKDANADRGHISVLAPIGSALLGLRVGQSITWQVPHGTKHIRVVEVRWQSEAASE